MNTVQRFALYVCLLGLSTAQAEPHEGAVAPLSESIYLNDVPQVLTISRLRQPTSETPTASTIVDRETIRAAGIIDLPEVFRLVPGFYVATNAGFVQNTNHVVSYHGLTDAYARKMQVLIDGRTIYQPLYGGVQWSEIPITINDIERIEITRGPNAASYGANAFLGTINIITQTPAGANTNRLSASHGNGRNELFYHHSGKQNELKYRISAGYREDDGLSQRTDFKRTNLLNGRGNLKLTDHQELEFQFGYAEGDRGEGDDSPGALYFLPRTTEVRNHFQLLKWNLHISPQYDFYVQAFHARDRFDDVMQTANLPFPVLPSSQSFRNPYEFDRIDLETQLTAVLSDDFQYAVGANIRRDQLYSPFWLGNNRTDTFDLRRFFAQAQYDVHHLLTVNAGIMIEDNDFTQTDISPRASLNVHLSPKQTLRFGYSEAFRTPSYLEEKFRSGVRLTSALSQTLLRQRFFNEGNLKPERIQSRELGYIGNWERLAIDAKFFNDTISNYIMGFDNLTFVPPANTLLIGGDVGTFKNTGSIDMQGFETQIQWAITADTKLLFNYANIRVSPNNIKPNRVEAVSNASPREIASFLLTHHFNADWDASFAGYYTAAVHALGDGNPVDSMHRFDARLARKFNFSNISGECSLNIQNVTDRHEQEFARYNELRRRAFFNVSVDF